MTKRKKTDYVVVHHSVSPRNTTVEQITAWHKARGFETIGYHWLINDKGIQRGRDESMVGAHCKAEGRNYDSVGVCVAGNYEAQYLSTKMRNDLVKKLADILTKYDLKTSDIYAHRNFGLTACCGQNLYEQLPAIKADVDLLLETNMVVKRVLDQTKKKHGDANVGLVIVPDDGGKSYLIKGGKKKYLKNIDKIVEALLALHAIGISKEDADKIPDGSDL